MQLTRATAVEGWTLEKIACIALLLFFAMQGAIPGIAPNQATEMTNAPATGLMKAGGIASQLLADGAICILALFNFSRLRRFLFAIRWTGAVALCAMCSTVWSQDAAMSARRSIPFALATVFGLYLASRFSISQQLAMICRTMLIAAIASGGLALLVPSIGLDASTGHIHNWQGIFTQKNACGRAMVFASAAALARGRLNLSNLFLILLFLAMLVMSGSRGAWVMEAVVGCIYLALVAMERFSVSSRKLILCLLAVAAVLIAIFAWMYFPWIAALMGKDSTLTGRTAIWQQVWVAIVKHPIAGYGFAAFWQGMKGESYNVILALRFVIFHAHNGFLEVWLELGAVGLMIFAASYFRALFQARRLISLTSIRSISWMIFVLVLVAFYNLDENSLLTFNGLYWVLYVAAVANIEILTSERKLACAWSRRTSSMHLQQALSEQ